MAKLTYFKVFRDAQQQLERNDRNFEDLKYVFLTRKNWTETDYLIQQQQLMPNEEQAQLNQDLKAILADQPPQYIVRQAWFYGRPFYVDQRVLIPQYDTETLLEWLLKDYKEASQLRVLEIGTGSGILAITLKLEHPDWIITATDISTEALAVAQRNAQHFQTKIDFLAGDLFTPVMNQQFDVILSNPPYIADAEKEVMDVSVLQYEPAIALFAKNDGLAFYQRFASEVTPFLAEKGRFYLEFGYHQKQALQQLFVTTVPEITLSFQQDLAGHDRALRGKMD